MANPAVQISDFFQQHADGGMRDAYHLYEPWDVEKRPEYVLRKGLEYNIDLNSDDNVKLYGTDPHPFQTGILMDESWCAVAFAGSRVGKSFNTLIDIICMLTGDFPYSLRFDKGKDTGVVREISKENISRWGRWTLDGEFLDNDQTAKQDGTWNCGNIIGVGHYPQSKVLPVGSKVWLATYPTAYDDNWKPLFQNWIPKEMKDLAKGTNGWSEKPRPCCHFMGGAQVKFINYGTGGVGFEGDKVPYIFADEEPPANIWSNIITHCDHIRMSMTPYNGVTFTYTDILLKSIDNDNINVYHATQFDSPYVTEAWMNNWLPTVKPWEIESRIFGVHADQRGKPYFYEDMDVLRKWATNLTDKGTFYTFEPTNTWVSAREIAEIPIRAQKATENLERDEWVVFEQVDPKVAYWMSVDEAEGSESDEVQAADRQAATVYRSPHAGENQDMPVIVASCRSTRTVIPFARNCLYACAYYNNALLAPEVRGEYGAAFLAEVRDWPFIFTMTVQNDRTKKPVTKLGFITTPRTRPIIFSNIQEWINTFADTPDGCIKYKPLLKEMMTLIVGKRGRPDHPSGGTTDSLITLGIGIYVWKFDKHQIRNNRYEAREQNQAINEWYNDRSTEQRQPKQLRALGTKRR